MTQPDMFPANPMDRALDMYKADLDRFIEAEAELPEGFYESPDNQMSPEAVQRVTEARSLALSLSMLGETGEIPVGNFGRFMYGPQQPGGDAGESVFWLPPEEITS